MTCITVSGGNVLFFGPGQTATGTNASLATQVFTGVYRLLGALYTDSGSAIVRFVQDSDTFYLNSPAASTFPIVNNVPFTGPLNGLPNGIAVEAFGRCVNGTVGSTAKLHIFRATPAPGVPGAFPLSPGYDTQSVNPATSFPYRVRTDTSRQISLESNGPPPIIIQCIDDGWVLHRAEN